MGAGPVPLTGLALGDGGMPKVSLGARGLLVLLRLPGTGGRRSGTEGDDMARLFCLSPGKNNSLGSAKVATVSLEWSTVGDRERGAGGGWGGYSWIGFGRMSVYQPRNEWKGEEGKE